MNICRIRLVLFCFHESRNLYLARMTALQKIKGTIKQDGLVSTGDSVLVALSGGPDSVALLHLLSRLRRPLKLTLLAVYVNHGIRPRAAKREERFCRELCDRLSIELTIVSGDIPALSKKNKRGLEEAAREFRYEALERLADEQNCNRIAVGHHADDQVETVVFRIFRGTGRTGMLGIPIKRGRIVRPLLHFTRNEILEYLAKNELPFCEDRSNKDTTFRRNYIRRKLLPQVRKHLNPAADGALLNLIDTMGAEEEYLEKITRKTARKCLRTTPGAKIALDLKRFVGYDLWLRRRLLRRCLQVVCRSGSSPDKEVIERLDRMAVYRGSAVSLPQSVQAAIIGDELVVYRRLRRKVREQLVVGERLTLKWPSVSFFCTLSGRKRSEIVKKARNTKVHLDWNKLTPPLEVRTIGSGDRFGPLGMTGHKKIGNYLTDRKVAREYRDEVLVVCDKRGIVWLVGFEIADRVKITKDTRKVFTIDYRVTKGENGTTI